MSRMSDVKKVQKNRPQRTSSLLLSAVDAFSHSDHRHAEFMMVPLSLMARCVTMATTETTVRETIEKIIV